MSNRLLKPPSSRRHHQENSIHSGSAAAAPDGKRSVSSSSRLLHGIFQNRNLPTGVNNNTSLSNARQRPSKQHLQALRNQDALSTPDPYQFSAPNGIQKNPFQQESLAEKNFHMKWSHQKDMQRKWQQKKRQQQRTSSTARTAASMAAHGIISSSSASLLTQHQQEEMAAANAQSFENEIENLIEEQEGFVVSSATEGLMEEYATKHQWMERVKEENKTKRPVADGSSSPNSSPSSPKSPKLRPINTDPYSVRFFHSDDLDSQRLELQFWESQVSWISERRRTGVPKKLPNSDMATKVWRDLGWGNLMDDINEDLEWEHASKSQLLQWKQIQQRRIEREEEALKQMQREAEERLEHLRKNSAVDEEEGEVAEETSDTDANDEASTGVNTPPLQNANPLPDGESRSSAPAPKRAGANLPQNLIGMLGASKRSQNLKNLRVDVPNGSSPTNQAGRLSPATTSLKTLGRNLPAGALSSLAKQGAAKASPLSASISTTVGEDRNGASTTTPKQSSDSQNDSSNTQKDDEGANSSNAAETSSKRKRGRPRKGAATGSSENSSGNTHESTPRSAEPTRSLSPDIQIPDLKNTIIESGDFLNGILWKQPENIQDYLKDFVFTKLLIDSNDGNLNLVDVRQDASKSRRSLTAPEQVEVSETDEFMNSIKASTFSESKENLITRHSVQHSGPAERLDPLYYPTHMTDKEYRRYYHPSLLRLPSKGERLPIYWKVERRARRRKQTKETMDKLRKKMDLRSSLSAHHHRSILIESVERYPMLLNKVGMGTRLVNYLPQKKFGEVKLENCADGDLRFVENSQELPLFTEMDATGEKPVTATENENYNAQLFPCEPPMTDFLLTARNRGNRIVKFQIRRPDAYYTMGHTQPLKVVPSIPGREVDIFKSNRVLQFIKDRFQETQRATGEPVVVKREIEAAFPQQKHLIREHLKQFCSSIGGGKYAMKKDALIPEKLVTPEEIASYDMTKADDVRLAEMGIDSESQRVAFGTAFDMSQNISVPNKEDQDVIRRMSYLILDASWRKTAEFHNLISASAERNFSLLEVSRSSFDLDKLRRMSEECKRLAHDDLDKLKHEGAVGGGSAMSDDQAKRILKEQGKLSDQRINAMSRIQRKDKARQLTESFGKVSESRKKLYIQLLSEKKKQALRKIYSVQAEKLIAHKPLYENHLETQRATMNADDEDDDRSETSSLDDSGSSDDEAMAIEEEYMDDETELNNQIRDMVGNDMGGPGADLTSTLTGAAKGSGAQGDAQGSSQPSSTGYRVVRTLKVKVLQPDGNVREETRREIITDPEMVDLYRKRDAFRKKKTNRKQIYVYTKEDKHMSHIFVTGKKENRRMRENYKRWSKRIRKKNEDPRLTIEGKGGKKRARPRSRHKGPKTKRRRKISIKAANERIRKIVGNYTKNNRWKAFREPVDESQFPDYKKHCKRIITLQEVYDKAKHDQYRNLPEFEDDIAQIEENCRHYCGKIHPEHKDLIPLVEELATKIRVQIERWREDVERAFHGETVQALIAKGEPPDFIAKASNQNTNSGGANDPK